MLRRAFETFKLPDTFWSEPSTVEAVARRDIGQLFRLVQRVTNATQTQIGTATGLSQAQVSEIMSGDRRVTTIDVMARVVDALDMPDAVSTALFLGKRSSGERRSGTRAVVATGLPEQAVRPVSLRPYVERALDRPHVSIDFAGFSGETLHGAMQEPLDKIRIGLLKPETISIRILVPDLTHPCAIPVLAEDLSDDVELRERAARIVSRHAQAIADSIHELARLGFVKTASAQIRITDTTPMFKLYILNHDDVFFAFYPVHRNTITVNGRECTFFDLLGKDTMVFREPQSGDPDRGSNSFAAEARAWFESVWATIAREYKA